MTRTSLRATCSSRLLVQDGGQGRVFYTSLGHREDLWSDAPDIKDRKNSVEQSKQYQAHILGGISWALGLKDGSAIPNPESLGGLPPLNPAP